MREYLATVSRKAAQIWWISVGVIDESDGGCFQIDSVERLICSLELLKFDTNEIAQLSAMEIGAPSYKVTKLFSTDTLDRAREGSQPCL
jgi:hypothetical protein